MKLNRHSLHAERSADRGVALVITLVMLSVTLVMAIAFLALARRERGSVSTATDTTTAKLAADSALAAAQSQLLANILATNASVYNFGLLISTNYINSYGFVAGSANPTNVNYDYTFPPGTYTAADFEQNIANLKYLPRVPVFIQTNPGSPLDFRFYLDLNRNGQFDDTGNNLPDILTDGTTNPGVSVSATGDPQWVGILSRPDLAHSANNLFLARYAFIAVPIGNGLDINAIHNQPSTQNIDINNQDYESSGYLRNEGVGSWEINLAAFLADLNTNQWDVLGAGNEYQYNEPGFANKGAAFDDALSILSYRYNHTFNSLYPLSFLLSNSVALQGQPVDLNLTGSLLTGTGVPAYTNNSGVLWSGSDNTNHFYDLPSEIFNPAESSPKFTGRLQAAGTETGSPNPDTYDRYTYYRMLAQLGTDSDPDDGKMNLNFRNITNGVVVPNLETNGFAWSPIEFFTNAADRMLRLYTTNWFSANPYAYLQTYYDLFPGNYSQYYYNASGAFITNDATGFGLTNYAYPFSPFLRWTNTVPAFGVTNIPVYVNGQFVYSAAVNRVLQLAANLYEASTNEIYPSVFRPVFEIDQYTNLFIVGYSNVAGVLPNNPANDNQFSLPYDVSQLGPLLNSPSLPEYTPLLINVYGVPWIIGAKANLPGFNQLTMLNTVQATRALQVGRKAPDGPIYTNHLYQLYISNSISASFWNSYSNDYVSAGNLSILLSDTVSMGLTNSDHPGIPSVLVFSNTYAYVTNRWAGSKWPHVIGGVAANNAFLNSFGNSFITTSFTNTMYSGAIYKTGAKVWVLPNDPSDTDPWESNNVSCDPLPQMGLLTTNWLRAIIVDQGHVIDYVQLRGPMDGTNFTMALNDPNVTATSSYLWSTNASGTANNGPSWGYVDQIGISQGVEAAPVNAIWKPLNYPGNANSVLAGTAYFDAFFQPAPHSFTDMYGNTAYATNPVVQAGYTASRTIFVPYLYQVNDPLVHYLADDLNAGTSSDWNNGTVANGVWRQMDGVAGTAQIPLPPNGVDFVTKGRYQPWGISAPSGLLTSVYNFGNPYNPAYKDPSVWGPDYWNFPTNKYPTVGWIGRVHRGTPWQTVYLKATNIVAPGFITGTNTWAVWTGDIGNYYDAANSAPVQDRLLFDLFTARPNDNAARGTLSVNQTNLAAWSGVFSGMVVLTNTSTILSAPQKFNSIPLLKNGYNIIQPAGGLGANSQLAQLVTAINNQRANAHAFLGFTNGDSVVGAFEHVGDILSVPQLTVQSPYLNTNTLQQEYGISDAEYEWIPQQMMGLVRGSSAPRYVIYGYGQALRPAANGLDTSGGNFGLVTNYQVVAESAVRAVVSVQKQINLTGQYPVTNYTTRVESYNVLPAD